MIVLPKDVDPVEIVMYFLEFDHFLDFAPQRKENYTADSLKRMTEKMSIAEIATDETLPLSNIQRLYISLALSNLTPKAIYSLAVDFTEHAVGHAIESTKAARKWINEEISDEEFHKLIDSLNLSSSNIAYWMRSIEPEKPISYQYYYWKVIISMISGAKHSAFMAAMQARDFLYDTTISSYAVGITHPCSVEEMVEKETKWQLNALLEVINE